MPRTRPARRSPPAGRKSSIARAASSSPCDGTTCPNAVDGVNYAPFASFGGWSGAINAASPKEQQDAAYDFLSYMSAPAQSGVDVTLGKTGYNPYRTSHFSNIQPWLDAGLSQAAAENYLGAIKASLENKNMVLDMRIPLTKRYQQDVLDTAVSQYLAGELDAAAHRAGHRRRLERDHRRGRKGQPSSPRMSPALASSGSSVATDPESLTVDGQAPETRQPRRAMTSLGAWRSDGAARWLFIWPTVLFILVPVAVPAGRVARPVALEAGLPPGRRRPQVHRLRELPAAPVRSRAEPLPGRPQVADTAGLGHPHRDDRADRVRLGALGPQRRGRPVRARPPAVRRRAPGRLRVAPGPGPGERRRTTRLADRHLDLRLRRDRPPVRPGSRTRVCSPSSRSRGGASSGSSS